MHGSEATEMSTNFGLNIGTSLADRLAKFAVRTGLLTPRLRYVDLIKHTDPEGMLLSLRPFFSNSLSPAPKPL